MKTTCPILLVAALLCVSVNPSALAATIEEIERLSFDEAYRLWQQEQKTMVEKLKSYHVIDSGTTDPKTGKFTPTSFWAVTCQLGREAHIHESFLVSALATNEYVSMILDTSSRLCSCYGIQSQAAVLYDPDRGYSSRMLEFALGPKERRSLWQKAMNKPTSQGGPAEGRRLPHSETNRTSSPVDSRR